MHVAKQQSDMCMKRKYVTKTFACTKKLCYRGPGNLFQTEIIQHPMQFVSHLFVDFNSALLKLSFGRNILISTCIFVAAQRVSTNGRLG